MTSPLARQAWLRVETKAAVGGGSDVLSPSDRKRLNLQARARLVGQAVVPTQLIPLTPNGETALTVLRLEGASAATLSLGRITGRTQLHFETASTTRDPALPTTPYSLQGACNNMK